LRSRPRGHSNPAAPSSRQMLYGYPSLAKRVGRSKKKRRKTSPRSFHDTRLQGRGAGLIAPATKPSRMAPCAHTDFVERPVHSSSLSPPFSILGVPGDRPRGLVSQQMAATGYGGYSLCARLFPPVPRAFRAGQGLSPTGDPATTVAWGFLPVPLISPFLTPFRASRPLDLCPLPPCWGCSADSTVRGLPVAPTTCAVPRRGFRWQERQRRSDLIKRHPWLERGRPEVSPVRRDTERASEASEKASGAPPYSHTTHTPGGRGSRASDPNPAGTATTRTGLARELEVRDIPTALIAKASLRYDQLVRQSVCAEARWTLPYGDTEMLWTDDSATMPFAQRFSPLRR